jgi:hypothetical protein
VPQRRKSEESKMSSSAGKTRSESVCFSCFHQASDTPRRVLQHVHDMGWPRCTTASMVGARPIQIPVQTAPKEPPELGKSRQAYHYAVYPVLFAALRGSPESLAGASPIFQTATWPFPSPLII